MGERPATPECRIEADEAVLYLAGAWRLQYMAAIVSRLAALTLPSADRVVIDGSAIEAIDTAGAFVLLQRLTSLGLVSTQLNWGSTLHAWRVSQER